MVSRNATDETDQITQQITQQITLRADSGFYSQKVINACRENGVKYLGYS